MSGAILETLQGILSTRKYAALFIVFSALALLVFSITSNILVPSTLSINPIAELPGFVLTVAIAVLSALNVTVLLHNHDILREGSKPGRATIAGSVAGFFASACPLCQPIWLVWLGLGSATGFLASIGLYVGLLSIGLLLLSLNYSLKSANGTCEVKMNAKNA